MSHLLLNLSISMRNEVKKARHLNNPTLKAKKIKLSSSSRVDENPLSAQNPPTQYQIPPNNIFPMLLSARILPRGDGPESSSARGPKTKATGTASATAVKQTWKEKPIFRLTHNYMRLQPYLPRRRVAVVDLTPEHEKMLPSTNRFTRRAGEIERWTSRPPGWR